MKINLDFDPESTTDLIAVAKLVSAFSAEAVTGFNKAVETFAASIPQSVRDRAEDAPEEKPAPAPKAPKTRAKKAEKPVEPVAEEEVDDTPMALAGAEEETQAGVTLADLQTLGRALLTGSPDGRDKLKKVLGGFGADRLSDVSEDDFADVAAALEEATK